MMKTLIVMRHAKSSWDDASLSDHDRPLNKRGMKDAPLMAQVLLNRGIVPDTIISSSAVRAFTTASLVAETMKLPINRIEKTSRLYEAATIEYIRRVQQIDNTAQTALVIGHNPTVMDTVEFLTGEDIDTVPTASFFVIEFPNTEWDDVHPGSGTLKYYEFPSKYKNI